MTLVYDQGQPVEISLTVLSDPTNPTSYDDPATLSLVITNPDGTTAENLTISQLAHPSTGKYNYVFDTTSSQTGEFSWRSVSTTPNGEIRGGFIVNAVATSLLSLTDYRLWTGDTTTDGATVTKTLADALALLEDECSRKFTYGSHTETLYVYGDGKVYPTNTPIDVVTSPAVSTNNIQGAGVYLGVFLPSPNFLNEGIWDAAVPRQVSVTYKGGFQPFGTTTGTTPQLPVELARAVCRMAYLMLHPSELQVPAGAKAVSVGDVSLSGDLAAMAVLDSTVQRAIRRFKKRPVRAWQRA